MLAGFMLVDLTFFIIKTTFSLVVSFQILSTHVLDHGSDTMKRN